MVTLKKHFIWVKGKTSQIQRYSLHQKYAVKIEESKLKRDRFSLKDKMLIAYLTSDVLSTYILILKVVFGSLATVTQISNTNSRLWRDSSVDKGLSTQVREHMFKFPESRRKLNAVVLCLSSQHSYDKAWSRERVLQKSLARCLPGAAENKRPYLQRGGGWGWSPKGVSDLRMWAVACAHPIPHRKIYWNYQLTVCISQFELRKHCGQKSQTSRVWKQSTLLTSLGS